MSGQRKRVWYILFFAFVFSVFVFGNLLHLITKQPASTPRPPDPTTLRPILYSIAGVFLLLATAASFLRLSVPATPGQFQTWLVLALALAEAACIVGLLLFFLGGPASEFVRFQIATVAVDLLFILPRIVRQPG